MGSRVQAMTDPEEATEWVSLAISGAPDIPARLTIRVLTQQQADECGAVREGLAMQAHTPVATARWLPRRT